MQIDFTVYAPIYSYYCPYKHYPLPMCFKCLYILPLYILCVTPMEITSVVAKVTDDDKTPTGNDDVY